MQFKDKKIMQRLSKIGLLYAPTSGHTCPNQNLLYYAKEPRGRRGGGSSAALKGLVDKSWDNVSSNLNGQKVEGFVVVVIIVVVGGDAVRPVANLRA